MTATQAHWSETEIQVLQGNPDMDPAVIAEKLNRSVSAVQKMRTRLKVYTRRPWSAEEIQMVRANPGLSLHELSALVGRPVSSCHRYRQIIDKEDGSFTAGDVSYRSLLAGIALKLARGNEDVAAALLREITNPSGEGRSLGEFRNA